MSLLTPPGDKRLVRLDYLLLGALLLAAAAARLFYAFDYADSPLFHFPIIDAGYHSVQARMALEGRPPSPGPYFKPPLYVWVLTDLYKLLGGKNLAAAHVFNSLAGLVTVALTYLLGRRLMGRRLAFTAALFVALYDLGPFFEEQALATALVTTLYLATVFLFVRAWDEELEWRRRRERLIWAGLSLGLACLARPNLLIFWPVVGALGFIFMGRTGEKRVSRRLAAALLPLGAALVAVLPAALRNLIHSGEFVLVSSNGGVNFFIGNGPGADGYSAVPPGLAWDRLTRDAGASADEAALSNSSFWYSATFREMLASPGRALGLLVKKLLLFFNGADISNNVELAWARPWSAWLSYNPLRWALAAPLGLSGLLTGLFAGKRLLDPRRGEPAPERRRALTLLLGFTLVYWLGISAFFVCSRYRLPLVPAAALLGALFIGYLISLVRRRDRRRLPGALICLAAAVFLVAFPIVRPTDGFAGEFHAAVALERQHEPQAALIHIERALELRPDDPEALKQRAEVRRELGDRPGMLADLEAAVDAAPDYVDAWLMLGREHPNPQRRLDALEAVIEVEPDHLMARMELATRLLELNRSAEALPHLEYAVELRPRFDNAHRLLGGIYLERGEFFEAAVEFYLADFYNHLREQRLERLDRMRDHLSPAPAIE